MKDVFKLAFSDFVVCTFSSNVCRLAYELRMALRPFVGHLYEVVSLDMDYFLQYGNEIYYETLRDLTKIGLGVIWPHFKKAAVLKRPHYPIVL